MTTQGGVPGDGAPTGALSRARLAASTGVQCPCPLQAQALLAQQGQTPARAARAGPGPGLSLPPGLFFPLVPEQGPGSAPARPSPPGDDKSAVPGASAEVSRQSAFTPRCAVPRPGPFLPR